jgi:OOP family OmpA-OmpF porin
MKLTKTVGALSLAGLAALNSPITMAADEGWYGGISIGLSQAGIADSRISSELLGSGLTMTSIDDDDRDVGFKLFAGRKFNKHFAVEGGYFNLGKFGFTANTTPAGSFTGSAKFQGLNLDAVGMLPMTQKFSLLARLGLTYTEAKDAFSGTGAVTVTNPNPKKSEGGYKYGLGVQYDFTPALGLRGEWERYRVNDAVGNKGDVDMLLIGLVYMFGGG